MKTADKIMIEEGMSLYLPTSEGVIKGTVIPDPKTKELFNEKGCVYVSYAIVSSWAGEPIEGAGYWLAKKLYYTEQFALDFIKERNANAQKQRERKKKK